MSLRKICQAFLPETRRGSLPEFDLGETHLWLMLHVEATLGANRRSIVWLNCAVKVCRRYALRPPPLNKAQLSLKGDGDGFAPGFLTSGGKGIQS